MYHPKLKSVSVLIDTYISISIECKSVFEVLETETFWKSHAETLNIGCFNICMSYSPHELVSNIQLLHISITKILTSAKGNLS